MIATRGIHVYPEPLLVLMTMILATVIRCDARTTKASFNCKMPISPHTEQRHWSAEKRKRQKDQAQKLCYEGKPIHDTTLNAYKRKFNPESHFETPHLSAVVIQADAFRLVQTQKIPVSRIFPVNGPPQNNSTLGNQISLRFEFTEPKPRSTEQTNLNSSRKKALSGLGSKWFDINELYLRRFLKRLESEGIEATIVEGHYLPEALTRNSDLHQSANKLLANIAEDYTQTYFLAPKILNSITNDDYRDAYHIRREAGLTVSKAIIAEIRRTQ